MSMTASARPFHFTVTDEEGEIPFDGIVTAITREEAQALILDAVQNVVLPECLDGSSLQFDVKLVELDINPARPINRWRHNLSDGALPGPDEWSWEFAPDATLMRTRIRSVIPEPAATA